MFVGNDCLFKKCYPNINILNYTFGVIQFCGRSVYISKLYERLETDILAKNCLLGDLQQ